MSKWQTVAYALWMIVGTLGVLGGIATFLYSWWVIPRWDAFVGLVISGPLLVFTSLMIIGLTEYKREALIKRGAR